MSNAATSQFAWGHDGQDFLAVELPCPFTEVLPGVNWGLAEEIFTPAFWKYQAHMKRVSGQYCHYRLGRTLLEEVSVCLLGGYGMPAELGLAAFDRLKDQDLLSGWATADEIEQALSMPFVVFENLRNYRFARQKARYLSSALAELRESTLPKDEKACRDYLTTLNGIGPKTASWVVRNHFGSNAVAILDIHIVRAGIAIGIFDENADTARQYYQLEDQFLTFCLALEESASLLDALMWDYMRRIGPTKKRGLPAAH